MASLSLSSNEILDTEVVSLSSIVAETERTGANTSFLESSSSFLGAVGLGVESVAVGASVAGAFSFVGLLSVLDAVEPALPWAMSVRVDVLRPGSSAYLLRMVLMRVLLRML